jgi:cell division protein FtsQ
VLADDDQRFLRRQKPVEVRRKGFTRRFREDFLPWAKLGALALGAAAVIFAAARFLLFSPALALVSPDQVTVAGNQYVSRTAIVNLFARDRDRSVLRIPLDTRRAEIERIAWVESARVSRALPNQIRVELVERQPVAFLRTGTELALIDAHGVILERPLQGDFRLPVVSGINDAVPLADREARMRLFGQFLRDVESVRPGASEMLSEVDLSSAEDLRATVTGLGASTGGSMAGEEQAVLVHFGAGDFGPRYRVLLENFGQWQAQAGHVASIDLRFKKQVVVNRQP